MDPPDPRSLDSVTFRVHALDTHGHEVNDLKSPRLSLTMPTMEMGKNEVVLKATPQGNYTGKGQFTMAGDWLVTVTATDKSTQILQTFPATVR